MKGIQEEVGAALRKIQEEMKQQANRERREVKKQKKDNRVILSINDLVFKKRLVKKLVDKYIGLYIIEKVISTNAVRL